MNSTNLIMAGSIASGVTAGLIPMSSLYKSGQEDRGVFNTGAHFVGATAVGAGVGIGGSMGITALAAKMTKAV